MNHFDITMEAEHEGLTCDGDGWNHDLWQVTLRRGPQTMRLPYKMGVGHKGAEPSLDDVLGSIVMDCGIVENDEIDEILGDTPYSKAHKIVTALNRQVADAKRLLGADYEAFWTQEVDV